MKVYIGKMHRAEGRTERDDFDAIYLGKSESELIEKIRTFMADWCDGIELFEERDAVMKVTNSDELKIWFDNNFATFSFDMEIQELA